MTRHSPSPRRELGIGLRWLQCIFGFAILLFVFPTQAYVFMQGRAVWPRGGVVIESHLAGSVTLSDGRQTWDAVAEEAMEIWNNELFRVHLYPTRITGGCADEDDRNGICWRSEAQDPDLEDALAITWRWSDPFTAEALEADIHVNSDIRWDSYRGPRCGFNGCKPAYDLRRVLIHELGHVLGLDHEDDVPAIMGTHVSNIDTLTADDIAGIHVLYPREYVPPTISISFPTWGQSFTIGPITVTGTASDDSFVSRIDYQVNDGLVSSVSSRFRSLTRWSLTVTPEAGTNQIRVWSIDSSDNRSPDTSTMFLYVPDALLTVSITGAGTATPDLNGSSLRVGRTYDIQAVPAENYLFTGWRDETGTLLTTRPKLSFVMRPNLTLAAQFVENRFAPLVGTYSGLFYPSSDLTPGNCGSLRLTLASNGSYSANMKSAGFTNVFSGKFDPITGESIVSVLRGATALQVNLVVDLGNPAAPLGRAVISKNWQADLYATRPMFSAVTHPATNYAGRYTATIVPWSDAAPPMGYGYATATIDADGKVTLTGKLPDYQTINFAGSLSEDGSFPVYALLYGNKGVLIGWTSFAGNTLSTSRIGWVKRAVTTGPYRRGFTNVLQVATAPYDFIPGTRALNFTSAQVIVSGGDADLAVTNTVALGANNQFTTTGGKVTVAFNATNGTFRGTLPASRHLFRFDGIVMQEDPLGSGCVAGTNRIGRVLIQPLPE